jgi:putative SOS response-associated peptidase YedK
MCGRYATTRSAADLSALFDAADETDDGLAPDYNVAPTDPVPIVRRSRRVDGRVVSVARWGLVPAWAPDTSGQARMINARAETVAAARAYARSFERRRCLVPADGWYEWRRTEQRRKQPYFMTARDGGVLAFAGIWAVRGEGPDRLVSCSVLTVPAVGEFGLVHDRMPLLLPPDRWAAWLADTPDPATLLVPPPEAYLDTVEIRPVGPDVGDVRNDGPQLVQRVVASTLPAVHERAVDLTLF